MMTIMMMIEEEVEEGRGGRGGEEGRGTRRESGGYRPERKPEGEAKGDGGDIEWRDGERGKK